MAGRYAIYSVPDFQSKLYRRGAALMGRCVETGTPLPRPALEAVSPDQLARHTRRASLYGFHGTIVAPFETDAGEDELNSALARIALDNRPFALNDLRLTIMDGSFAAIVTEIMPEQLKDIERQCVRAFSRFRLPLTKSDLARREPLPPKLRNNLIRWGYHLVFDEFKFHLTLADSLPDQADDFIASLQAYLEPVLNLSMIFDRLALFHQPSRTEPFICRKVFLLQDDDNEH